MLFNILNCRLLESKEDPGTYRIWEIEKNMITHEFIDKEVVEEFNAGYTPKYLLGDVWRSSYWVKTENMKMWGRN